MNGGTHTSHTHNGWDRYRNNPRFVYLCALFSNVESFFAPSKYNVNRVLCIENVACEKIALLLKQKVSLGKDIAVSVAKFMGDCR